MATCKACNQPLVLELDPEDFNEATSSAAGGAPTVVPDDVELSCGCHYHWQCLLDESPTVAAALACPSCNAPIKSVANGADQVLVRYTNEGGIQDNLDILPNVREEAYLDANPSARPARAYLTFCSEGDVLNVVELLQTLQDYDEEDDEEEEVQRMHPAHLLRYQDPLNGMKSAIHLAIENNQMDIVWLLLWIASDLPDYAFPEDAVRGAQAIRARRDIAGPGPDIRSLRDERGQTADDLARMTGGQWQPFVNGGFFRY